MTSYGGSTQTDGYSGDGLRAWKQTSAGRTYFLYDGSHPVGEYSSTGVLTAINTFGADGLISRHTSSGSVFYTFDERGSVSQRLTSSGTVASSDLYDSYGARNSTGGSDVWGFEAQVGYYSDAEAGLVLCTHRFYDTSTGRWLTRDPIGYDGGINLYGYTKNSSITRFDASGYDDSDDDDLIDVIELVILELEEVSGAAATEGAAARSCAPRLPAPEGEVSISGPITSSLSGPGEPTYWRYYGGDSQAVGGWLTPQPPTTFSDPGVVKSLLSLPSSNTAEYCCEVNLPSGVRYEQSIASPIFGGEGGGIQIQLLQPVDPLHFGPPLTFQ